MVSTVALASGPERERYLRNKDPRADMRICAAATDEDVAVPGFIPPAR